MILPTTIEVNLNTDEWGDSIFNDICDYASEFITDTTGFCHNGFEIEIKIVASHIKWDVDED